MRQYKAFDKAIEIDPKLCLGLEQQRLALDDQGKYDEAIKA